MERQQNKRNQKNSIETLVKKLKFDNRAALRTAINDFVSNSSIHGIRYIGDPNYPVIIRLMWLLAFLMSLLVGAFFIQIIYDKSSRNPILMSLSKKESAISEVSSTLFTQNLFSNNNMMRS